MEGSEDGWDGGGCGRGGGVGVVLMAVEVEREGKGDKMLPLGGNSEKGAPAKLRRILGSRCREATVGVNLVWSGLVYLGEWP